MPTPLTQGPIPLYYQLERALRDRIRAGEFQSGDALPTEEQLCHAYGVSRITVRRALDSLCSERLVSRRRGRGTFVAAPAEPVKRLSLTGSLAELVDATDLSYRVVSRELVAAPLRVSEALGLPPKARVLRLELINLSSGEVFACSEFFFPPALGALISEPDVATNVPILQVAEAKLNERIVRAQQSIEPTLADATTAHRLGIKPRSAVLKLLRVYFNRANASVMALDMRCHPERYRYTVELIAGDEPCNERSPDPCRRH